tara:strand:- start:718 stop:1032 length:315 start_codon:yes stop_codon:yes gene_type:complete
MYEREERVSALTTLISFAFLVTSEEQRHSYLQAIEIIGRPDEVADAQKSFEEILNNAKRKAEDKRGDSGDLGGGDDPSPGNGGGVDGVPEDVGANEEEGEQSLI